MRHLNYYWPARQVQLYITERSETITWGGDLEGSGPSLSVQLSTSFDIYLTTSKLDTLHISAISEHISQLLLTALLAWWEVVTCGAQKESFYKLISMWKVRGWGPQTRSVCGSLDPHTINSQNFYTALRLNPTSSSRVCWRCRRCREILRSQNRCEARC